MIGSNVKIHQLTKYGDNLSAEDNVILGKPFTANKLDQLIIGNDCTFKTGAIIYLGSEFDSNFIAEEYVIIYPNVKIGKNVTIGANSIIGVPYKHPENKVTLIGEGSTIRSQSVIYAGIQIGKNFNGGHGVKIREFTSIGDNSQVGTLSQIEGYSKIGNHVKLHTNVHVGQFSVVEDHVFIAPGTVLTNTLHPLCPRVKECIKGPTIRAHVKIGSNVTVSPGIEIKENSVIGSGTNVIKDVPSNSVVVGNPGKVIKNIYELTCPLNLIEKPYSLENNNITDVEE